MSVPLVSMCVNDAEPPQISAHWVTGDDHVPFVVLNVGAISLYIEAGQVNRLSALLVEMRAIKPQVQS